MAQPGEVVYGFTPYYDIARNHDYTTQFWFRIPSSNSVELTVVADGNVRIILTGNTLKAYISESDIRQITSISMNEWHDIMVEVFSVSNTYLVTVDGTTIHEYYPFIDETETEFVRATSQMFVGEHRHAYTGSEAFWDDQYTEWENNAPELDWCGTPGYDTDGVDPDSGTEGDTFTYCVKYSDVDNDEPESDYPQVHIRKGGSEIAGSPFPMSRSSWLGSPDDYRAGARYKYSKILPDPGNDYAYEFKAKDAFGLDAVPLSGNGPEVHPYILPSTTPWCDWSMFRYDIDRNGLTLCEGAIAPPPSTKWIYNTGGWRMDSSPSARDIDQDERREVVVSSNTGNVYSLNGATGIEKWVYTTTPDAWMYSTPALGDIDDDGRVEVVIGSDDNNVYALDGETKAEEWIFPTGNLVRSSPALVNLDDDIQLEVLVGSVDTYLYAIDGKTGTADWSTSIGGFLFSSPAIGDVDGDNELEVVIGGGFSNRLVVLDGKTGTEKWHYDVDDWVFSTPALRDIDNDGHIEIVFASNDGWVYAIDGITQIEDWKYFTSANHIESSPALGDVDNDAIVEVIIGSYDGNIYTIDGVTGLADWTFLTGGWVTSSAAIADIDNDGQLEVVAGSWDNKLYAINGQTGFQEWAYDAGGSIASSPAISDVDQDGKSEIVINAYPDKVICLE
jgi:outer membrane protein assembly factor BamB